MTLNEVLEHRNLEGTVYACDLKRWLGIDLPYKDKYKLVEKLTEIEHLLSTQRPD